MFLMLVNGPDEARGFGRVMRCGSSGVFSCKDWGTTLDGGGEKCLLQGSAPSGVKDSDVFLLGRL